MIGIHLATKEQWGDVDAIGLRNSLFATRQRCEGGHEIWEIHLIADLSRWHTTRLVHNQRHFDTSFIELSFPAFESCVTVQFADGSHHSSPIVGGEDNQRVLAKAQIVEGA